jgi:hypothetical protein
MSNLYDEDVIAWAEEQSRLLRSRQWSQRVAIGRDIARYSSHTALLGDSDWLATAFGCARAATFAETGQPAMTDQLPWTLAQLTSPDFWPDLRRTARAPGAAAAGQSMPVVAAIDCSATQSSCAHAERRAATARVVGGP